MYERRSVVFKREDVIHALEFYYTKINPSHDCAFDINTIIFDQKDQSIEVEILNCSDDE